MRCAERVEVYREYRTRRLSKRNCMEIIEFEIKVIPKVSEGISHAAQDEISHRSCLTPSK